MGFPQLLIALGGVLAYILLGAATARLSRKSLFKAGVFGENRKRVAHLGGMFWPILWAVWTIGLPFSLVYSAIGWLAGLKRGG